MSTSTGDVKRHPIRGALWGLIAGLGLALLLFSYNVVALGTLTPYVVIVLGVAAGIGFGALAPAKGAAAQSPPAEDT